MTKTANKKRRERPVLPTSGGAWRRQADGTLVRDEPEAPPAPPEPAAAPESAPATGRRKQREE